MNACFLLTLLTLVGASDDFNTNEIKKRMKLIGGIPSYGVQSAVPKIEDKSKSTVEYSEPKLDLRYNSTADFNPKGMGHLYTVSDALIKLIQPNKTLPEGFLEAAEKNVIIEYIKEKWPDCIKHYPGIFGILVLGLVLAGLMPIVGLIFWCCRCCGNCGGVVKYKKQNDSCKRTTLTLIFGGMAVLILFGVVCAFVTNEYMNESFRNVTTKISISMDDAQLYLNNTELETDTLLHENFQELKSFLVQKFSEAGEIIKDELAKVSHANVLEMLSRLIEGMEVVKKDLTSIQSSTRKLQDLSTTLADYLDVTKEELLQELHNCRDIPGCRELLNHRHIAELKVVENFSELPDVSGTYFAVSELTGNPDSINSIQQKILEGKQKFDDIKFEISDIVQKVFPKYESAFQEIEAKLNILSEKIRRTIHEVRKHINEAREPVKEVDFYTNKYGLYRYYIALGTSGALLIILLCITMGILYGVCGKRPDEMYSDDRDCCNTASGARFLMLAVWLMFFLSTALLLIALAHFVLGITVEVAVCEPLKNPSDTKTFQLVDKYLNVNDIYENKKRKGKDLKIGEVIPKAHRNVSIYEALKLEDVYNISQVYDYLEGLNISKKMLEFRKGGLLQNGKFELLTPEVIQKLKELADSSLNDIHFEKYAQLLKTQITNINLTRLSNELRSNAEKIPDHSSSGFDLTKVKKLLRAKARFLELLERDSVAQILNEIEALKFNVTVLKDHLKFNHTSLRHALEKLIDLVDKAQKFLFSNGKHEIGLLLNRFVEDCEKAISDYLDRVVNKTKFEIGKSAPLSNAYNATIVATCDSVMKPFNGFWVSVGWSLVLFIPVIIFAVMLSVLYSKSEPYTHPGMYGESEYLYDAYGDRHIQVPLTVSQSEKKKKNHHKNNQDSYENGGNGAYLQDYSAHLGRSDRPSASNEARYNDMAPKHWGDFSNARGSSNPPRYHHPSSTEYERPPPYYFPGPERG